MPESQATIGLSWGNFPIQFEYAYKTSVRSLEETPGGRRLRERLAQGKTTYDQVIEGVARYQSSFARIPVQQHSEQEPFWNNGWLPSFDGALIYSFLAERRPSTYLEIGSGNSTKFARRAVRDHDLATRIVSIDPYPRAEIDALCDTVIRESIESVPMQTILDNLRTGDVVFIDNSHRSFQGSDVTLVFTELFPALPPGILFGVHDIFLPYDYPEISSEYFYNEQYLLFMYLLGNVNARIVFPTWYCCKEGQRYKRFPALFDAPAHSGIELGGSSFWLQTTPS